MTDLLQNLRRNAQRGSKPRCHSLVHGTRSQIASRLTEIAKPFATVSPKDYWMPDGFEDSREAQLHKATALLDRSVCDKLKSWWLEVESESAMTPNFDIASTCTIKGAGKGLLLIEAKAHDEELKKEEAGRLVREAEAQAVDNSGEDHDQQPRGADDRARSHEKIGRAIEEARLGLQGATSLACKISRDACYQMSNRFAWTWKLTDLGVPVVLVYLGFLQAYEMIDQGEPFAAQADWERLVKSHSAPLMPPEMWNRSWGKGTSTFVPLIRSRLQPLERMLILIAGPYRSGTNDDPALIQRNVDAMEDMALKVFRRGHLPVLGEWFALPLLKHAGSNKTGDAVFDEIFHPVARELIGKCDAVLRIGGPSAGADDMVATGERLGKRIFRGLPEIPERRR